MKKNFKIITLLFSLATICLFMGSAIAADSIQATPQSQTWNFRFLLPIAVPLVIAIGKELLPRVPAKYIPLIAPLLGAVAELLVNSSQASWGDIGMSAILGSAGVGVRELVDQLKKGKTSVPPVAGIFLLGISLLFVTGCAGFKTEQYNKTSFLTNGVVYRVDENRTKVGANTFWDSKSELSKVKATQTDKTQSIGVGSLSSESSGTNTVAGIQALRDIIQMMSGH
jgi:hypothetical protein